MAKSNLQMGAVVCVLAGAVALASPSWASGATSAVKKPGPSIQSDTVYYSQISHNVRHQGVSGTTTEFSSANRTSGHNVKWK
jgi:hypothetical protein